MKGANSLAMATIGAPVRSLQVASNDRPHDRWLLMRLLAAGSSTPKLADRLITEQGSLGAVLSSSEERLRQLGADNNGIAILKLLKEAVSAVLDRSDDKRLVVKNGLELAEQFYAEMAWLSVEQVRAAYIDVSHRVIRIETLSTGTLQKASIYPREIARRALELSARGVVLVHNHPSGDPTASAEDIRITDRIRAALSTLDIELINHLIISKKGGISMRCGSSF